LLLLRAKLTGVTALLCDVAYWVLPNLERLNIKSETVHDVPLERGFVTLALIYGLSYALVVLALACAAFERKEFN
jgi:hypothetical protein